MGQSTEELTTQIETTRGRMAADLDTLQDKVSPSAIVERRKQAAPDRVSSLRNRVMGTADDVRQCWRRSVGDVTSTAQDRFQANPLGVGLMAFGAGLVIVSLMPASKAAAEAAHRLVEAAKEHGEPLVEEAKAAGQDLADDLRESATDATQQVKEGAQQSAATVRDGAQGSLSQSREPQGAAVPLHGVAVRVWVPWLLRGCWWGNRGWCRRARPRWGHRRRPRRARGDRAVGLGSDRIATSAKPDAGPADCARLAVVVQTAPLSSEGRQRNTWMRSGEPSA